LLCLPVGCSAAAGLDGGAVDAGADSGVEEADAGADAGEADAGVGLPAVCEGACRTTTATVSLNHVQGGALCPACVGMPAPAHPEGFVALEVQASFPEGGLSGHVFATHCDSMDVRE
ncbi:MAG: hypothetical protein KC933_08740, partial [Myxococcales bacterium]|nr:hypothetical protein [Myxococcales bacterium]